MNFVISKEIVYSFVYWEFSLAFIIRQIRKICVCGAYETAKVNNNFIIEQNRKQQKNYIKHMWSTFLMSFGFKKINDVLQ